MSNLRQGLKKLKAKGLKKGSKKKFPDLSGDGKVTMKDILMGRGVVKAGRGDFIARRLGLMGPGGRALYKTKDFLERRMELQGVKTTKGMTKAEINKLLGDIKDINKRGVASPKSKKRIADTTKVTAGAATVLGAQEIDKKIKKKAAKKRGPKKSSKTSKADIIGKGSPKGRAQGGAMKKSVDMKKKIGKDRITLYDVQEAQKLLDATQKGTGRGKAKAIESRMKKALGKAQGGMMVKGQGAAIRGTKFKGTF